MSAAQDGDPFKPAPTGGSTVRGSFSGKTHRFYNIDGNGVTGLSIKIPDGGHWFGIQDPDAAISYEINSVARDPAGKTSLKTLTAGEDTALRPVMPGEYINISHATDIEDLTLVVEGGVNLPQDASGLDITAY